MEFLPLLLPDLSEMPALQGRAEMSATDSEFCWTLRRFGLLFASEGVGLESREFETENGEDKDSPHRWRLRAHCIRPCPEGMVRVYARLVSANEKRVQGRYALRSYFSGDRRGEAAADLAREGAEVEDGVERRKLEEIPPEAGGQGEGEEEAEPWSLFLGWAGKHTEYSTKIVRVHLRTFHLSGDSEMILHRPAMSTSQALPIPLPPLDDRLTAFVSLLYLKLTENIRTQLAERQRPLVSVRDQSMQTEEEEDAVVDWDSVSRQILARVLRLVREHQAGRAGRKQEQLKRFLETNV